MRNIYKLSLGAFTLIFILLLSACQSQNAGGFGSETSSGATATVTIHSPLTPGLEVAYVVYPYDAYPTRGYPLVATYSQEIPVNEMIQVDSLTPGEYSLCARSENSIMGTFIQNILLTNGDTTAIEDTLRATGIIELIFANNLRRSALSVYIAGSPIQTNLIQAVDLTDSTVHLLLSGIPAATYSGLMLSDHRTDLPGVLISEEITVEAGQIVTVEADAANWIPEGSTDGMITLNWTSPQPTEMVVHGLYASHYNALSGSGGTRIDSTSGGGGYTFQALPYDNYNIFATGRSSEAIGATTITVTNNQNTTVSDTLYTASTITLIFDKDVDTTLTCYLEGSPYKVSLNQAVQQSNQNWRLEMPNVPQGFSTRLMIGSETSPYNVTPCSDSFAIQDTLTITATPFSL